MNHIRRAGEKHRGLKFLADLVHYRTYPAVKSNRKKETREEVITRVKTMHQIKFPWWSDQIEEVFEPVYSGFAVPSMRSMQFGGMPIFRSNARIFNCAYAPLTSWKDFADLFWLLLNGVGVGYSVQLRHVSQLPVVSSRITRDVKTFVVPDSKEGWADAVWMTLNNHQLECDFSQVRPRGSVLSTGGVASGPEPLAQALQNIKTVLRAAHGRQLTPLETFDIMCYLADIVVVGAVRRAATIAQFDAWDEQMLQAKTGEWYKTRPHRMRANISAVLDRDSEDGIALALDRCFASGSGEPGVLLSNNFDMGFNPCAEVSLRPRGLCNLTETNAARCASEEDFLMAVASASAIGTLQATYTDFDYLHPDWQKNAQEEALLGVSITGQAEAWDLLSSADLLQEGAATVLRVNERWADMLDINVAARGTTVKPAGSTSAWWGTTSGIHAAHADKFLRRVRVDRKDSLGRYLVENHGEDEPGAGAFIETDAFNSENIVISVPIDMSGAIMRHEETALELLERAKHIYMNWVVPGHRTGHNTHNVSLTVNFKPEEQVAIKKWMVDNRECWSGISLLPFDGGTYQQMPFEEITDEEYHLWLERIPSDLDFTEIEYFGETDRRAMEFACLGGACEVV